MSGLGTKWVLGLQLQKLETGSLYDLSNLEKSTQDKNSSLLKEIVNQENLAYYRIHLQEHVLFHIGLRRWC